MLHVFTAVYPERGDKILEAPQGNAASLHITFCKMIVDVNQHLSKAASFVREEFIARMLH